MIDEQKHESTVSRGKDVFKTVDSDIIRSLSTNDGLGVFLWDLDYARSEISIDKALSSSGIKYNNEYIYGSIY